MSIEMFQISNRICKIVGLPKSCKAGWAYCHTAAAAQASENAAF
jgi:hypothetical protein